MRVLLQIFLVAALACGLTACGTKGKLKSPSQIAYEKEKEARREAKAAKKAAEEQPKKEPAEEAATVPDQAEETE